MYVVDWFVQQNPNKKPDRNNAVKSSFIYSIIRVCNKNTIMNSTKAVIFTLINAGILFTTAFFVVSFLKTQQTTQNLAEKAAEELNSIIWLSEMIGSWCW